MHEAAIIKIVDERKIRGKLGLESPPFSLVFLHSIGVSEIRTRKDDFDDEEDPTMLFFSLRPLLGFILNLNSMKSKPNQGCHSHQRILEYNRM